MAINIGVIFNELAVGMQYAGVAGQIVTEVEADVADLEAHKAVSVTVPSVGGSIHGIKGKFSGSITFTPDTP